MSTNLFGESTPLSVWVTGGAIGVLLLCFIVMFVVFGLWHWRRLRRMRLELWSLKTDNQIKDFERIFAQDKRLAHLWHEYGESLHEVEEVKDGQVIVTDYRATALAEMYFHSESVFEARLHAEFFKHVPGIFTGIGIIGTFYGLINGLKVFQVSENAATVRASLEGLMHSVGEAFTISFAAITCAMLVTFLEKVILAGLSNETAAIVQKIDASFEAGVGEEYLSRLVGAAIESASQTKILKDALVSELSHLLREITEAQISASKEQQERLFAQLSATSKEQVEAARQDNEALGATIAESIRQSLEGPMQDIASTVKTASGDQSASAVSMLQDVMSSFSQKLSDLFGGQISGINSLNKQAADNMQEAVQTLRALVGNMEEAGKRSSDAMADKMADAIDKMEARQEAINSQSAAFIDQIRELVATSQTETNQKLQSTLETLGSETSQLLGKFNASQLQALETNQAREQALSDRTAQAVGSMTESVESVVAELSQATNQMAESVASLTRVTSTTVGEMNAGATKLGQASRDFADAGARVSDVMNQTASVSTKLAETSGALSTGGNAIQELLRDYQLHRGTVENLVAELRATVEAAKKEAALTGDILSRIENSAQRLSTAQRQADEYLEGVSRVLGEAHSSFASSVTRTLDKANNQFHEKLTAATGMLHSSVEELGVTLGSVGNLAPKKG